jgi:hypothetical protein
VRAPLPVRRLAALRRGKVAQIRSAAGRQLVFADVGDAVQDERRQKGATYTAHCRLEGPGQFFNGVPYGPIVLIVGLFVRVAAI